MITDRPPMTRVNTEFTCNEKGDTQRDINSISLLLLLLLLLLQSTDQLSAHYEY